MLTSEQQKIFNVRVPKGGYGYYTLYRGVYDPSNNIDERPTYAETGDLFEPYNSSVVYKATRSGGKTTWAIDENAKRQSETGEGGSGSSLPSMTGKNGKVLGVTLDSEDKEQAEWVTPSGGGAEKFVVTLTKDTSGDNPVWEADKTVAEIVAADAAGKIVVATATVGRPGVELEFAKTVMTSAECDGVTVNAALFSAVYCDDTGEAEFFSIVGTNRGEGDEWGLSEANNQFVDPNAPLIVTMTADESVTGQFNGDKTYSEALSAMTSGKNVTCIIEGLSASHVVDAVRLTVESEQVVVLTLSKLDANAEPSLYTLSGSPNEYIRINLS